MYPSAIATDASARPLPADGRSTTAQGFRGLICRETETSASGFLRITMVALVIGPARLGAVYMPIVTLLRYASAS